MALGCAEHERLVEPVGRRGDVSAVPTDTQTNDIRSQSLRLHLSLVQPRLELLLSHLEVLDVRCRYEGN